MQELNRMEMLKERMKDEKDIKRPIIAKNYPTISFTYRDVGRFQLRFIENDDGGHYELHIFHGLFKASSYVDTFHPMDDLTKVKDTMDLLIDNHEVLYSISSERRDD